MSTPTVLSQKLVPAQVGFLAIYNPSLGPTDDTIDDQIVYYSSTESRSRRRRPRRTSGDSPGKSSQDERNERLRKIGLAQGMVEFGRDFSDGRPVDTIETEKSRIILHELESGWWLIASIDLTRLPISKGQAGKEDGIEYSSREVKPPALLLEDLLRAHSTFLLHHASSMSALFVRSRRSKFVNLLGRYWDSYLSTWNVMLHGNPLVNVYGGIKLAGSGELGMGVGEEDRGSGEREVLEGFVGRIEGLVDLVVSKFGDAEQDTEEKKGSKQGESQGRNLTTRPWLGTGAEPTSEDGAVFLGVGALSRKSLRDITHWMEDLYSWGSRAYGVRDNPTATRNSRKKKDKKTNPQKPGFSSKISKSPYHITLLSRPGIGDGQADGQSHGSNETIVPTSPISPTEDGPDPQNKKRSKDKRPPLQRGRSSQSSLQSLPGSGGKFVSYLKLGYGTHWSLGGNTAKAQSDNAIKTIKQDVHVPKIVPNGSSLGQKPSGQIEGQTDGQKEDGSDSSPAFDDSFGHYLIGLMGDIERDEALAENEDEPTTDEGMDEGSNHRTLLRTVTVELERESDARLEADISIDLGTADNERSRSSKHGGSEHTGTSHASFESQDRNKTKKLRIVVYVNKPFIFAFLFELRTDALALSSLYRSLHHQLGPLQRPLLASTRRLLLKPEVTNTGSVEEKTPIYDFVWDSKTLTISSTIPNIPEPPGAPNAGTDTPPWSRIEALNTHMQLLNTFATTRYDRSELEITCKTSRGWWVVWTRVPDTDNASVSNHSPSPVPGTRTPQMKQEDSIRTSRSGHTSITGTTNPSMYSGPAHPFLDRPSAFKTLVLPNEKEIFLVRRASDYVDGRASGRFLNVNASTVEGGWGSSTAKLAQGIGVDTKRYIESLLTLNS